MKAYRAPVTQSLLSFYGDVLTFENGESIAAHLERIAEKMLEGIQKQENCILTQLNNYHPKYLGAPISELKKIHLDKEDCYHSIANEFGFNSWHEVTLLNDTLYNTEFEAAVNQLITGDITALESTIIANPELTKAHSQYGHKASLLHYTSSNGVELWRQQVPHQLSKIITFLIENGANKKATMQVYGGMFTAHELFVTSAHPFDAGLGQEVADLLIP